MLFTHAQTLSEADLAGTPIGDVMALLTNDIANVRMAALDVEGDMEESMGEVDGEFQGNRVDLLTSGDVEKWNYQWRIDKKRSSV